MSEYNNASNLEQEEKNHPSFYGIIPADIRYCKSLEPNAKLLYCEITALCKKEGYCWATNQYFADLYDVKIRVVQNWLESLKKLKFIETKFEITSFGTRRKIYINISSKINSTGCKKMQGGVQKNAWEGAEKCTSLIYMNTKEEEQQQQDQNVVVVPKFQDEEEKIELLKPYGLAIALLVILLAYPLDRIRNAIAAVKQSNPDNPTGFLRSAIEQGWTPNANAPKKEKETLESLAAKFKNGQMYGDGYECEKDDIGIGFYRSGMYKSYSVTWISKDVNQFKSILDKIGFKYE